MKPHSKVKVANVFSGLQHEGEDEDEDDEEDQASLKNENVSDKTRKSKGKRMPKMPKMPKRKNCTKIHFGGYINVLEDGVFTFEEKAKMERDRCTAERACAIDRQRHECRVCFADKPTKMMPECSAAKDMQRAGDRRQHEMIGNLTGGWQYLSLTVDSGAAETVIPHDLVTDHRICDTEASRSGLCYASATGQPIPNLGEQRLPLMTVEGTMRGMTFQAAPVSRPLGSVKKICKSGHRVVFDEEGSYIQNKANGEINWMREEQGNYILDLWVMPNKDMDFVGQP